jgi:hypothetical protein
MEFAGPMGRWLVGWDIENQKKERKIANGWAGKDSRAKIKLGWGENEIVLQIFLQKIWTWIQKFKYKSNTFLNSDKLKYFPKTKIWDFWIKIILKLNSKFKSRII